MSPSIIRPPQLRTRETEEAHRSATWLELFYDLVFVVAVANLGHRLLVNVTWGGAFAFIGYFIPVWWAWNGATFYADRYDTDDLGQRVLAVFQMIAIALMAASISGDTADSSRAFAVSYIMTRVVLIIMYSRARRNVPETRELVTGYMTGFSAELAFWVVSLFVPEPWRFVLWGAGLVVGYGTPYYYRRLQARVPLSISHLPERFGLFSILVLGESIAAVVAGLSHEGWSESSHVTAGVIGVLVASSLWWLYFDNLEGRVVRRRSDQARAWRPTVWIYSHLPLHIALTAAGIGLEFIVAETGEDFPASARWLLTLAVAFALVAMGAILFSTVSDDPTRRDVLRAQWRLVGAAAVLVVGLVATWLTGFWFAVLLGAVVVAQVAIDVVIKVQAQTAAA